MTLIADLPNPLIIPVGFVIGILVSAPVGPVNVLCMQRALQRGFWGGVMAGLGAVVGDGLIALCAALGIGAVSSTIKTYRTAIQVIGGLALIGIGLHTCLSRSKPFVKSAAEEGAASPARFVLDTAKSFALTITNPGAVLGLFAIFGGIGSFVSIRGHGEALTLVAAVVAGCMTWWVVLSFAVERIDRRYDLSNVARINAIAGVLLLAFGVMLIGEVVFSTLTP